MSNQVAQRLRKTALFKGLSTEDLTSLAAIVTEKSLPENATIFTEHMPGEALYIIDEGSVRVSRMIEEGEEQTLSVLGAGDFIGEMALLDGGPRLTTARALKPTKLFIIKNGDFQSLLEKDPKVGIKIVKAIIAVFSARLRHSDLIIKELLLCSGDHCK